MPSIIRAFSRLWKWLSHMDTAVAMPSLARWLWAAGIAVITALAAWLRDQDPIVWFGLGMIVFAVMMIFFDQISVNRWRRQNAQRETEEIAESPEQIEPKHNTPIHVAIDYVAEQIGDCNSDDFYPTARHALRRAASEGQISIHGKKELEKGYSSKLRTPIPQDYWSDQELNELTTGEYYIDHDHTRPEQGAGFKKLGRDREKYWGIRVNMDEVRKKWP